MDSATYPVVLLPANGSRTKSFASVKNLIKKSGISFGILAGCISSSCSLQYSIYLSFAVVLEAIITLDGIAPPLSFKKEEFPMLYSEGRLPALYFPLFISLSVNSCRGDDFQTGLCERYNFHQQSHACILI